MHINTAFFLNSVLLGVGLAMDAFSVSLANGLHEPKMKANKQISIAIVFAAFQAIMPLIGWFSVVTIAGCFDVFRKFIPWIALVLLCYIGGGMIREGLKCKCEDGEECNKLGFTALIIQGIATSIDALSVGFTISDYSLFAAILCALIISTVTFFICTAGVSIGKRFGTGLAGKSSLLGGAILIFIGLKIFFTGIA